MMLRVLVSARPYYWLAFAAYSRAVRDKAVSEERVSEEMTE